MRHLKIITLRARHLLLFLLSYFTLLWYTHIQTHTHTHAHTHTDTHTHTFKGISSDMYFKLFEKQGP